MGYEKIENPSLDRPPRKISITGEIVESSDSGEIDITSRPNSRGEGEDDDEWQQSTEELDDVMQGIRAEKKRKAQEEEEAAEEKRNDENIQRLTSNILRRCTEEREAADKVERHSKEEKEKEA